MTMAFGRKDAKKSSYYVWFLGAKEAEGLRGDEFILPVLRYLIDQEELSEVPKVTLQVSNKGLKIIQNVPKKSTPFSNSSPAPNLSSSKLNLSSNSGKTEQIKHLIPHNAITCVVQEEDLVACILLIYNPITKCPVHVHAYRCDSIETASSLRGQLQLLIEKPENQRKFKEIESRLALKGLTVNRQLNPQQQPKQESTVELTRRFNPFGKRFSSESRSTRTESSEDSLDSGLNAGSKEGKSLPIEITLGNPKVAILYESLAAELKAKLSNPKSGPILLPPKDYDTISRKQGKLTGIEVRKCTNLSIVRPLESPPSNALTSTPMNVNKTENGKKTVVGSSLSTSSSSSASSSVLKRTSRVLPSSSTSNLHIIRSESSCKSSSGIGSDEPDKLSSSSASPFNRGMIKGLTSNYRGDVSSDDSERNWSPIESGPSSSGSATSSGLRLLTSSTNITANNDVRSHHISSNHIVNNKMLMISNNNANNSSKNIHHHHSHLNSNNNNHNHNNSNHHHLHLNHNNNNNNINNKKHETVERLETNRLNSAISNVIKGNHHHHHHQQQQQQLSSTSSFSSSSLSSSANRVSIPAPVIPKTTLITTKPVKTDLIRRVKDDLRPVITGVTPHSTSSTSSSSSRSATQINSSNSNNNHNLKGKVDPPRYYFPDQIVSNNCSTSTNNNNNNGQVKTSSSSDNHHSRRLLTHHLHSHHHDYPSECVKPSTDNIINITNPCARLKPTRDFIRIQPLSNYQRSPISY